jgi:multiple sugar transport system permease protein
MYVYKTAFEFGRMGYASALAWVQILVTILLAAVVVVASRRFIHYRGA